MKALIDFLTLRGAPVTPPTDESVLQMMDRRKVEPSATALTFRNTR